MALGLALELVKNEHKYAFLIFVFSLLGQMILSKSWVKILEWLKYLLFRRKKNILFLFQWSNNFIENLKLI